MLFMEYTFITILKYLINYLVVQVFMSSKATNFIPREMVIKNGAQFENITSSTRVTNLCN